MKKIIIETIYDLLGNNAGNSRERIEEQYNEKTGKILEEGIMFGPPWDGESFTFEIGSKEYTISVKETSIY